jgi:hypothetical protein
VTFAALRDLAFTTETPNLLLCTLFHYRQSFHRSMRPILFEINGN